MDDFYAWPNATAWSTTTTRTTKSRDKIKSPPDQIPNGHLTTLVVSIVNSLLANSGVQKI